MCLYVRDITLAEGRKLQNIIRRNHNHIKMRRAQVVMASAQGSKVPAIAARLYFSPQHIRTIIKEFNATGFDALVLVNENGTLKDCVHLAYQEVVEQKVQLGLLPPCVAFPDHVQ